MGRGVLDPSLVSLRHNKAIGAPSTISDLTSDSGFGLGSWNSSTQPMVPAYRGAGGAHFNAYDLGIHPRHLVPEVERETGSRGRLPEIEGTYHNTQTTTPRNGVCVLRARLNA